MSEAYKELVRAVQALCLVSAEDGTLPDDESLHRVIKPLARALMVEVIHSNPCERRHASHH